MKAAVIIIVLALFSTVVSYNDTAKEWWCQDVWGYEVSTSHEEYVAMEAPIRAHESSPNKDWTIKSWDVSHLPDPMERDGLKVKVAREAIYDSIVPDLFR